MGNDNGTVAALAALIRSANLSEQDAAAVKRLLRKPRSATSATWGMKAWLKPGSWITVLGTDGQQHSVFVERVGQRSARLQTHATDFRKIAIDRIAKFGVTGKLMHARQPEQSK